MAALSIMDLRVRDGMRQSVFRSYAFPTWTGRTLTVLCHALYTSPRQRSVSEPAAWRSFMTDRFNASLPEWRSSIVGRDPHAKGADAVRIGDQAELQRLGISVVQHLPAWGKNRTMLALLCLGVSATLPPRNNMAEATFFWKTRS